MFKHASLLIDIAFSLHPAPYGAITAAKSGDGQWRSSHAFILVSFSQLRGYFEFDANISVCIKSAWPAF